MGDATRVGGAGGSARPHDQGAYATALVTPDRLGWDELAMRRRTTSAIDASPARSILAPIVDGALNGPWAPQDEMQRDRVCGRAVS